MKNTTPEISKAKIILWFFIIAYIVYFSFFTIMRYRTLHAYYLDLGIMHQTVYNTYRALTNLDWSRVLEHTEPFGISQVKRMAIHNDIVLAPLAIFYLIYASPATLLVIQAAVLGLGAWFIFKIAQLVFEKSKHRDTFSLLFSIGYLFYPPLQKANMFDFHGVTLATTFLLAMFYFWLKKRYRLSFLFVVLALITKEQVGLTTAFFGLYVLLFSGHSRPDRESADPRFREDDRKRRLFSWSIIIVSLLWFALSVFVIIPYFRGGSEHFALEYYGGLSSPITIFQRLFGVSTWSYLLSLFGPTGFISLLSPLQLIIAAPEFGINLLSGNPNLRNIYYHYTSVITPFIYISSIYGARFLTNKFNVAKVVVFGLAGFILLFAYLQGPLPFAKMQEVSPFVRPFKEAQLAADWSEKLKDEKLKISTSGKLAPYFSSRRYFYNFSRYYEAADYVVIMPEDVYNYSVRESLVSAYRQLQNDKRFKLIFKQNNFEVYKKI